MADTLTTPSTTVTTTVATNEDSKFLGTSVRAWLAIILVATVCIGYILVVIAVLVEAVINRDFAKIGTFTTPGEPIPSLTIAAVAYYMGQRR